MAILFNYLFIRHYSIISLSFSYFQIPYERYTPLQAAVGVVQQVSLFLKLHNIDKNKTNHVDNVV